MTPRFRLISALVVAAALAGCRSSGDIIVDEGVGIQAFRTACPAVGIPDFTGDITVFRTPGDTSASNVDVVAAMTNVRSQCNDTGDKVYTNVTFDVLAKRTDLTPQPAPAAPAGPAPAPAPAPAAEAAALPMRKVCGTQNVCAFATLRR